MSAAFGFLLPALQLDNHRGPYNLKEKALGNVLIQVGRLRGRSRSAGVW